MPGTPTQKKKAREHQTEYCLAAERNERHWHYTQDRRFHYYSNPSGDLIEADCSAYVDIVYWDTVHDLGVFIASPLGFRYTGIGNTSSAEAWLREHGTAVPRTHKLLVGDIARWGQGIHAHMAVVRSAGSWATAILSSHGREAGPLPVNIDYRDDLVGVWRHPFFA